MIVDLNIQGRSVLVIGAGVEGTRKVRALLGQGCRSITVVSSRFNRHLLDLAREGKISVVKRRVRDASILDELEERPFLVMAATNDKALNRSIVERAKTMGILAYAADDPAISDFIHPAVINIHDTLFIAISTKGSSPAMARLLRIKAERVLKRLIREEDVEMIRLADYARGVAFRHISDAHARKDYIYTVIRDREIMDMLRGKRLEEARARALSILESRYGSGSG
ncbi:MAG: bifunctional precorrin-2 dehydrogenase/sirohydrochlorin ferrochelatase [Candidatus Nitrosocaldus sp.]|nr:bifunctional precorrin-2 dehydrogenase/sirohydrochlorin ferrochelatase [Candidatus Nitrosocaldus sp.]MCS7141020.1 bifunctional precorrin-2 dehydrogenase/sirohydrochlorin ferrochelatase [Candidatus Nitrosocaldus sp.]MDW7999902.1 bifunctional precorrin-2 dehydrogenase/sirohydrochlorin ferrochelatase [Candidatus Nitrosocaldus sp.]MDW8276227.1 bifunctional precorrin-2 dehydrogenase/sirohydrochlorin ferrochelatase [Candidatus Nitrosocaldus sp.]